MKRKLNKTLQRERNVLIGFVCVTLLIAFFFKGRYWKIMLFLYVAHCIWMSGIYYRKSKNDKPNT